MTDIGWLSAYISLSFKKQKILSYTPSPTVILGFVKSKIKQKNNIKWAQSYDKLIQDVAGHGWVDLWGGGDCG